MVTMVIDIVKLGPSFKSRYKWLTLTHWVPGAGAIPFIQAKLGFPGKAPVWDTGCRVPVQIFVKFFFLSKQSLDFVERHLCALPGSPR